jgi:FkbM family methyltransferase
MQIPKVVRRLTYSSVACACIRGLGLRKLAQSAYAGLQGNPGSLKLSLGDVEVNFAARTPHELRCVEGTWFLEEKMVRGVLSGLRAGDTFLDAGSNLGLFSMFAAKAVGPEGTVVAFEPETVAYGRVSENIRINGFQNVQLFKMALSDERTKKKLILGDPESVMQSAHLGEGDGPSEIVESTEYDRLAQEKSLQTPRVVKMDIEGHEFAALRGMQATLSNPHCIAFFGEVHPLNLPQGVRAADVIGLIKSFGFGSIHSEERFEQIHVTATKDPGRLEGSSN